MAADMSRARGQQADRGDGGGHRASDRGEWLKPAEAADKRAIIQAFSRQQRLEGHDREAT